MLRVIDAGASDPREGIALDAALFATLEEQSGSETLGFWESDRPAVVVGSSAAVGREVDQCACLRDRVPIIRRASGGGAVLLAPGCLNYSLVLSLDARPEMRDVRCSYRLILGRLIDALAMPDLTIQGASDLAIDRRKVSGNAQRRGRHTLLHHGTLLYQIDLQAIERYVKEPARQPAYRADRRHTAFLRNMPRNAVQIKDAIIRAFGDFTNTPPREEVLTTGVDLPGRDGFK